MFDFFNRLFKPVPPSGVTAKERLRLVLLSDHLSLAPDVIEALKRDLLVVISRYVEIDQAHADVSFEHREGEVAMLASIPITGVRERTRDDDRPQQPPAPTATAAPAAMELPLREEPAIEATSTSKAVEVEAPTEAVQPQRAESVDEAALDAVSAATVAHVEAPSVPEPKPGASNATTPRRRRRRKSAAAKRAGVQTVALNKPAQA